MDSIYITAIVSLVGGLTHLYFRIEANHKATKERLEKTEKRLVECELHNVECEKVRQALTVLFAKESGKTVAEVQAMLRELAHE